MTRSVYLTAEEELGLEQLARANALAPNAVLRYALRRLLGLSSPPLTLPASSSSTSASPTGSRSPTGS